MVKVGLIIIILFMLPSLLLAKREHPEKWYQERWCREQGGQIEVVLPDKTRCDCVTDIRPRIFQKLPVLTLSALRH
jgi:hypothetical protein